MRRAKRGVELEGKATSAARRGVGSVTSAARSARERSENDLAGRRPRLQGERSETAVAGLNMEGGNSPRFRRKCYVSRKGALLESRRMFDSETPGSRPSVDCKAFGLCLQKTCR